MAVTAEAGGTVDYSSSVGPAGEYKQIVGSIAGAGSYLLGANELTVGSKNTSTEVSGVISGTGGSLVKIGAGTLTLSAANTYGRYDRYRRHASARHACQNRLGRWRDQRRRPRHAQHRERRRDERDTNIEFTSYSNGMSAGTTAITNSGTLEFVDTTTAGSAQITSSGTVNFRNTSSASNATLTINSGTATFYDTSSAGSATIINSGSLNFRNSSTAGKRRRDQQWQSPFRRLQRERNGRRGECHHQQQRHTPLHRFQYGRKCHHQQQWPPDFRLHEHGW